jgi:hypothetical protein
MAPAWPEDVSGEEEVFVSSLDHRDGESRSSHQPRCGLWRWAGLLVDPLANGLGEEARRCLPYIKDKPIRQLIMQ